MAPKELSTAVPMHERFTGFWRDARHITRDAVEKTGRFIPLQGQEIVLSKSAHTIPDHGHSGHTSRDGKTISIVLNPGFPDRTSLLSIELPRSVSHELHHSVRFQVLGCEQSLKDAVIREGLAVHFETDVWGGMPSAWATALDAGELSEAMKMFEDEIRVNDSGYDHDAWFYGTGKHPRWAGYALGYHIVKEYLNRHPGQRAASLVTTSTDTILSGLAS